MEWAVRGDRHHFSIYSPSRKFFKVRFEDFLVHTGRFKDRKAAYAYLFGADGRVSVSPAAIKSYPKGTTIMPRKKLDLSEFKDFLGKKIFPSKKDPPKKSTGYGRRAYGTRKPPAEPDVS